MKRCTKCGEEKPLEDFYVCRREKSGYSSRCKTCESVRKKCMYAKRKANPPLPVISKKCSRCGKEKPASEFYTSMSTVSGLSSHCKICVSVSSKDRYNLNKTRETSLQRMYGITVEDYDTLLKEQSGKCAVCGSENPGRHDAKNFAIDHDHDTGKIRGLLCQGCNIGIGHLDDDPERLEAAAAYLRKHKHGHKEDN